MSDAHNIDDTSNETQKSSDPSYLEGARVYSLAHGWRQFEHQREQEIMLKMIAHLQETYSQRTMVQVSETLFAVELFMNVAGEERQQVELHHYDDPSRDALSYPLRQQRAIHHVHVVDILERHQQLLEQALSWNEEIIQMRLLE